MLLFIASKIFILIISTTTTNASPDSLDPHPLIWSSCFVNTPWIKGSGAPIKSWLKSVVVYHEDKNAPHDFIQENRNIFTNSISSSILGEETHEDFVDDVGTIKSNIRWHKFGNGQWDGWLYGPVDSDGQFTGNNIAYIYADFVTVIYGTFEKGILIEGKERKIKAFRCHAGMMELKFSKILRPKNIFKFEDTNSTFVSSDLTLMDPLERRTIYLGDSNIKGMTCGDGLFAKKNIPPNSLVAIYAGWKVSSNWTYPDGLTADEQEDFHKNLLHFDTNFILDVPPHMDKIHIYRASLGHKFNHKFVDYQVDFCFMKHPRFGDIRCIQSLRPIKKGEEIFINYNYDTTGNDAPRWYTKLEQELKLENQI